jgi:sugar diacid utilization regulator
VNTSHYRLTKIEERTGVDTRRVGDVVELLIAALAALSAEVPSAPHATST